MARIFISYSRVDSAFVEKLYQRLQQMRPNCHIWYDQAPYGLLGDDVWWDEIMNAIAASDIFIYVLSNEAVQSKYCQAEFAEARRLQKRIITIQARDRTRLTGALRDIHYVDMKHGVDDPDALVRLSGALDRQVARIRRRRPLWQPRTPKPAEDKIPARPPNAPDVDTPTLQLPAAELSVPDGPVKRPARGMWALGAVAVMLVVGALILVASGLLGGGDGGDGEETPSTQAVGLESSDTPPLTETPTPTWTPLDIADIVQTLDAQATADEATLNVQATAAARATGYAIGTQSALDQTATATWWTAIPTATSTPTETPSPTPTLTDTPTTTPTDTPTPTPDPLLTAAQTPVSRNDDWEPFVQTFDGVEMVLVPAGCFEMGATEFSSAQPVHRVCFEEPFWIDRTEVTNGQFAAFNGQAERSSYFSGDDCPREDITWTEAQAFCESRGARLPTEAEWEYAARGPDSLEYPWGDEFDGSRFVWNRSSDEGTASVGSLPVGASWVGAVDMSGNVWEWVADWYSESYYASLEDGAVDPTGPASGEYRVLRGGAWRGSDADLFRASYRGWYLPDFRVYVRGFRCARSR